MIKWYYNEQNRIKKCINLLVHTNMEVNMKLVTATQEFDRKYGLKTAIKLIKDYGFDAYDCNLYEAMKKGKPFASDDYLKRAEEIREYADNLGISCVQAHAPLPNVKTIEGIKAAVEVHKKAIEISAVLGAEIIIIHPSSITDVKGNYELLYSHLLPVAKKNNIKIAAENMFVRLDGALNIVPGACGTPEDFVHYIDYISDPYFTACLDIGHTCLPHTRPAQEFIRALGNKRLGALHIHSNSGHDDQHAIPFYGKADWDEICYELAKIDYQGNFTLEAYKFLLSFPDELIPYAVNLLHKSARLLMEKIEKYRTEIKNETC